MPSPLSNILNLAAVRNSVPGTSNTLTHELWYTRHTERAGVAGASHGSWQYTLSRQLNSERDSERDVRMRAFFSSSDAALIDTRAEKFEVKLGTAALHTHCQPSHAEAYFEN